MSMRSSGDILKGAKWPVKLIAGGDSFLAPDPFKLHTLAVLSVPGATITLTVNGTSILPHCSKVVAGVLQTNQTGVVAANTLTTFKPNYLVESIKTGDVIAVTSTDNAAKLSLGVTQA